MKKGPETNKSLVPFGVHRLWLKLIEIQLGSLNVRAFASNLMLVRPALQLGDVVRRKIVTLGTLDNFLEITFFWSTFSRQLINVYKGLKSMPIVSHDSALHFEIVPLFDVFLYVKSPFVLWGQSAKHPMDKTAFSR